MGLAAPEVRSGKEFFVEYLETLPGKKIVSAVLENGNEYKVTLRFDSAVGVAFYPTVCNLPEGQVKKLEGEIVVSARLWKPLQSTVVVFKFQSGNYAFFHYQPFFRIENIKKAP